MSKQILLKTLQSEKRRFKKSELVSKCGMNEREIRLAAAELCNDGFPILSSCHTPGYWIASSYEDFSIVINEYKAKGKKCFEHADKLEKIRDDMFSDQIGGLDG